MHFSSLRLAKLYQINSFFLNRKTRLKISIRVKTRQDTNLIEVACHEW